MNIAVCVKPVPDVSIISLNPHEKGRIDPHDIVYTVNAGDMVAVEEAVRIKEKGTPGHVTLVSMAPPSTERILRRYVAIGADEAILLWDENFQDSDSYATGLILAKALGPLQYDLILCGNRSPDTNAGQVGYAVASILGIPIVTGVTSIAVEVTGNKIAVERKLEKGNRERIKVPLPTLLAVDEGLNEPRYASLPSFIAAFRKDIKRYAMGDLGLSAEAVGARGSKTRSVNMSVPRPRPKKIFTPDSSLSSFERMRLVMSGGVQEKGQEVFEGSPEELSSKFIEFLKQVNILGGS
jgi:electron transfer flavoprotein beta subunit